MFRNLRGLTIKAVCRIDCKVTNVSHLGTCFHRKNAFLKHLVPTTTRKPYNKREGKILLRNKILDRCHFWQGIKEGAYQFCEEHNFEWIANSKILGWKNSTWTQLLNFYMSKEDGVSHSSCMKWQQIMAQYTSTYVWRLTSEALNLESHVRFVANFCLFWWRLKDE